MEFVLHLASRAVTVFSVLLLSVALVSPVYGFDDPPPCNGADCYPVRVYPNGSFHCVGTCPASCGCSSSSTPVEGGGFEYTCTCLPVLP